MSNTLRADHVGSLLRPAGLLRAREAYSRGSISRDQLREEEEAAILEGLERQRQIGLEIFTDGEFRRDNWAADMADAVVGFVAAGTPIAWRGPGGGIETSTARWAVAGKLQSQRRLTIGESTFLSQHSPGPYKVTMPAPSNFFIAGWAPGITDAAYADRTELAVDVAGIIRREVQALIDEGARYIQLDAPYYCALLEGDSRERLRRAGVDPTQALSSMIAADNAAIEGLCADQVTIALHVCRGNSRSRWLTEGGYDAVAESLFNELSATRLLLEYDSARADDFTPLRFVPPDKTVVLGLVTTKEGRLESASELCRRIDLAADYLPLEQLALSPQCGFASVAAGNLLSEEDQWRKLELVVQTAQEVWKN